MPDPFTSPVGANTGEVTASPARGERPTDTATEEKNADDRKQEARLGILTAAGETAAAPGVIWRCAQCGHEVTDFKYGCHICGRLTYVTPTTTATAAAPGVGERDLRVEVRVLLSQVGDDGVPTDAYRFRQSVQILKYLMGLAPSTTDTVQQQEGEARCKCPPEFCQCGHHARQQEPDAQRSGDAAT